MSHDTSSTAISEGEFVAMMALCVSLVALAIDAMLPAMGLMAHDLGLANENDAQLVVGVLFLGMCVGQAFAGPVSDSVGRKPVIYVGLMFFIAGSVASAFAENFTVMLVGRALQGIGAAAPRIVCSAIVRDLMSGRAMARTMSLIGGVFIVVPVVAPLVGQGILWIANWRTIFLYLLGQAVLAFVWFAARQRETHVETTPFSLRRIWAAARETLTHRISLGYSLVAGFSSGGFIGYLSSSRQLFQEQYALGEWFSVCFAILALAIGTASFTNARMVERLGMRALCLRAQTVLTCAALVATPVFFWLNGHPPLWLFMLYLAVTFFCLGILFGNCSAAALEPLGHIAGTASAVVSSLVTFLSVSFGIAIGRLYDGTVLPLVIGFLVLGCLGQLVLRRWLAGDVPSDASSPPP